MTHNSFKLAKDKALTTDNVLGNDTILHPTIGVIIKHSGKIEKEENSSKNHDDSHNDSVTLKDKLAFH